MRFSILILLITASLPAQPPGMKLVWSDEFDRPGRPDPAKWVYEEGFVRNNEAQYYTRDRRENARVENGLLVIEARQERWKNPAFTMGAADWAKSRESAEYTSASLTTEGKASWTNVRVEVRAKLPTGRGTWPAIWMLGNIHRTAGWPLCGEIDIMENVGFDPDVIHANIHTAKYNHAQKTNKGEKIVVSSPYRDFHVYAVEWDQEKMDFSVDGKVYFTYQNEKSGVEAWPFGQRFYLILNIAIGGSWGGQKGIDNAIFPQRMEVDWVRVYSR